RGCGASVPAYRPIFLANWPVPRRSPWPPSFLDRTAPCRPAGSRSAKVLRRFEMLNYFVTVARFLTQRLGRDDRGSTAVEYGLMVALIAAVIVTAVTLSGPHLTSVLTMGA